MELLRSYHFDASPHEVYDMFVDEEFVQARLTQTGALTSTIKITAEGSGVRIKTHRDLPPQVPDWARKFVGETISLDEVERWQAAGPDGSRDGTIFVEITGAPVQVDATSRLAAGPAGGTEYTVTGTITASVPLFGKKIQEAAAPAITAALDKEADVGRRWLAGDR